MKITSIKMDSTKMMSKIMSVKKKKKKKKEKTKKKKPDKLAGSDTNNEESREDNEIDIRNLNESKRKKKNDIKKIKNSHRNEEESNEKKGNNNSNNDKDRDKKKNDARVIIRRNKHYSLASNKNIKFLNRNEFINNNSFFVFPHTKNVVDLERKIDSSIDTEKTNILKNNKTQSGKKSKKGTVENSNEKRVRKKDRVNEKEKEQTIENRNKELLVEKNDNKKNTEQNCFSTLKSVFIAKEDTTISVINSFNESETHDNVYSYLHIKSKGEIKENEEEDDMLFNFSKEKNLIASIREFESIQVGEENKEHTKEEKSKNNDEHEERKKISEINKDEEKEKINNNNNNNSHSNNKKEYVETDLNSNNNSRINEEEQYVTYKIPRYLKKKNIKCPFVYKNVFYGKYGIINYDLKGNENGPLVVTFHGLNGTNLTFLEIQNILIIYKFQVLNFDLYGHGLSACPKYNHKKRTYGIDFFLSQTEELLNHLNLQDKELYLIGFSMGCIIAISFARKYIKQVKKIILISPVGVLEKKPFILKLLKMFPCIINISSFFMIPCFISKKKLKNNDSQNDTSDYLYNRIMWQAFVKKNITHSILGCVNNLKMWSAHEIFKEVGMNHIPVLILCGEKDNICNVNVFKNASKYFTNSHLIIFKNASHLVLVEKNREVIACILTFFHFPDNADLKLFHYIFPVDKMGSYVVKDKRFSKKYSSTQSYLADIDYVPNIFISFVDKEQEYKFKKKKKLLSSFDTD